MLFPALRVVTAGDIVSGKNLPILDANNGGSGLDIGDTIAKRTARSAKRADTVITGHSVEHDDGGADGECDVQPRVRGPVRAAKKEGKTVEEVVKTWTMPAKYQGYSRQPRMPAALNVQASSTKWLRPDQ